MTTLTIGLIAVALLYIASKLWRLVNNYRAARATGLPIVVCPYDPKSVFWLVFSVPLRPILRYILPTTIFALVDLSIWGWEFREKAAIHDRFGPVFFLVNTGVNRLVCADPSLAHTVLLKRKVFMHPDSSAQIVGFLGPNIISSKVEDWSRHRRIVAPCLNERISPEVWDVSVEQASSLADILLSSSVFHNAQRPVRIISSLRRVAMNVLAHIAYGHNKQFALDPASTRPCEDISYVDAISLVTEHMIYAAMLPASLLRLPFLPWVSQQLGIAKKRLPGLAGDMLDQERQKSAFASNGMQTGCLTTSPGTIMKTLVRLSDEEKNREEKSTAGSSSETTKIYLTEEEIVGNLFVFTAAGFETTANTLSYATTMLTAYPEWQTWIQTEIDDVFGGSEMSQPDYAAAFPKLVRCLAVMLETLRLFPPITLLMRTMDISQSLVIGDSAFYLTAPCNVYVNSMGIHTSSSIWGPDALSFNPARWLQPDAPEPALITPPQGTFLSWSAGPRVCPGQKMSQVEFVAVIATLFRRCSARPMVREGESMQMAKDRLLHLAQDSQSVVALRMNKPEEVGIEWVERIM